MSESPATASPANLRGRLITTSLCLLAVGCGGGLAVNLVEGTYERPSNVAMFFTVDDSDGNPVGGMSAEDFRIYEDGRLVSVTESNQTIVNQEVAAEHFTLLLVDMSGSVEASDQLADIQAAAEAFTRSIESDQRVALYAFDGSEDITRIQPFRRGSAVGRLSSYRTRDPSTNLHGAMVQAVSELQTAMEESDAPLRFGTIVVFTDGSDRAARVSRDDMVDSLDDSGFEVFAIGVGTEIDEETLDDTGRSGYVFIGDAGAIESAFATIGARIQDHMHRYYLLSYCSPARAGQHEVTVQAVQGELHGETRFRFDATDFGPDCNPNRPPEFATRGSIQPQRRMSRGGRIPVDLELQFEVSAGASAGAE